MFAVKAGAKKVYAVDACPTICRLAQELIKCNHFQDRIEVINKRVEEINEFDHKIDIIVSEWMGEISNHLLLQFMIVYYTTVDGDSNPQIVVSLIEFDVI